MRPLAIWPWPLRAEDMQLVKDAKAAAGIEEKVMPSEAVPGSPVRVLALGSLPPFVCDAGLVKEPTVAAVADAIRWVLQAPAGDRSGFMVEDYMKALLGEETRELEAPPCHCERDAVDFAGRGGDATECRACHDAGCYLTEGLCLRD